MFARLQLPVSEFVAMQSQRLVRITTPHSPHLAFALFDGPDTISLQPLAKYCCSDDTTLAAAIKRMAKHGLHRLWIVGASLSSAPRATSSLAPHVRCAHHTHTHTPSLFPSQMRAKSRWAS